MLGKRRLEKRCPSDGDRGFESISLQERLLWPAHQNGGAQFQRDLADALLEAPNVAVKPVLAAAVAWLQQRSVTGMFGSDLKFPSKVGSSASVRSSIVRTKVMLSKN